MFVYLRLNSLVFQADETESLMRKGYLRLAELATLRDDLDEALKLYDKVNSVQAVYSQAQVSRLNYTFGKPIILLEILPGNYFA